MELIKDTFLNLKPVAKTTRTRIDGQSGLYLEQNHTGYTFQLKYKSPMTGNRRFMKLSRFSYGDNINKKILDNVLKQLVINQGIVAQGIDPIEKKKAERRAQKPVKYGKTVSQVFDAFTETHHFKHLADNTTRHYLADYRRNLAEFWGKREVASLKRSDILTFINDIKKDTVANGVIRSFQRIQEQAIDLGIIESPFLYNIKTRPAGTRTQTLTDDELIILMNSMEGSDSLRNIAKFQLLTACRVSEVSGARWDEFDMKAKTWTIPPERIKTERAYKKMNRPHIIPLMPKMAEILLLQKQYGTDGLVFKKTYKTRAEQEYYHHSSVGDWLKNKLGIKGGTHQLRRTAASRLSEIAGVGEYDLKLILNHAASGATKIYINSQQLNRKREVYGKWHHYIDSLLKRVRLF